MLDTPVTIPRSRWWDDAGVRVSVAWPEQPPPPEGYPVLCLLDSHAVFATAVDSARLQAGRPGATGVQPGVIVGLGHTCDEADRPAARRRDYTPPDGENGGADAVLRHLETSILPEVARSLPIDPGRVALFGHSLAGLVPLQAMLTGTGAFRCFIAASPSLWWADHAMLRRAACFAPTHRSRLLLTVGGAERPNPETADPQRLERQRRARMVESVLELAECLAASVDVTCIEFPGENHGSVLPAAVARAIPFALGHPA